MDTLHAIIRPERASEHQRVVMQVLLAITLCGGLIYSVVNFLAGKYVLMTLELVMATAAFALIPIIRRTVHLQAWMVAFTLPFYSVMIYGMYSPNTSITVFYWVTVIPLLGHLLLGRVLGTVVSVVFISLAGMVFVLRFGDAGVIDSAGGIVNIVLATFTAFGLAHFYEASRESSQHRLAVLALTDPLTGLPNRACLTRHFEREMPFVSRDRPLSLIMVDIDYFKQVNDRYGHDTGDRALCDVAQILVSNLRGADLPCRLGGEEFAILSANASLEAARQHAEDMRRSIAASHARDDTAVALTASFGVASLESPDGTLANLLSRADRCLYIAKSDGRDCVAVQTQAAEYQKVERTGNESH